MKRRLAIAAGLLVLMAACVWLLAGVAAPPRVSMRLVAYQRWPHGAIVRLTNGSGRPVQFAAEPNGTPAGKPLLCREKTSSGAWTNTSPVLKGITVYDPRTAKTLVAFVADVGPVTAGRYFTLLEPRQLNPGESVEFFVQLEPRGPPRRVGTVCLAGQSRLGAKLQPWISNVKKWLRMKAPLPGQFDVWCPDTLSIGT